MTSLFAYLLVIILAVSSRVDSACTQNDIRLVNGPTARQGRVEFCRNNIWGTVCDDFWGFPDARVVCSQLNYDGNGAVARTGAYFGAGSGTIWLDNVQCNAHKITLASCSKACYGCHNCNHNEDAGVECPPCYEGNVWLPVGNSWREGTVEVCYDGVWSTICDDAFGNAEAQVVCSMLGYDTEGAEAFSGAYFGERYGPIILDDLGCTGNEKSIFNCSGSSIGVHDCTHGEDAGVRCPFCEKGTIRLWSAYKDTPPGEGMIHYCHTTGEYKAMCRWQWDCLDAKVACRNLGFNGSLAADALVDVEGAYGYFKPILAQRVYCDGSEATIDDCTKIWTTWCDSPIIESAGVRCVEDITGHNCTNGNLRLVNGKSSSEGRLEYCFHSEWSPFCTIHDEEASVACKQLGYKDYFWASVFSDERFGTAGYVSDFDSITCSSDASEDHMINCTIAYSTGCTVTSCSTEYGIKCFNPGMCEEKDVRLVGGTIEQEGRIEICYNGVWSTVCDTNWQDIDSYVVCRSLGYDADKSPITLVDSYFSDGLYPIGINNVACNGWEKSVLDCNKESYLQFECARSDLAGVRCYEDCTDGSVRLVGGDSDSEGTVEICNDNLWGLVTEAGWDDNDAKVVCRMIGFSSDNAISQYGSFYGKPNKTVHYTNVHCTGAEDSMEECTKTIISLVDGTTIYKNVSVVGVDCFPEAPTEPSCVVMNITAQNPPLCNEGEVRLVNGSVGAGRAEFCFNGHWSPFCNMNEATASVICKQLSFNSYTWASITDGSFGNTANYSHFDNITCDVSASNLSSCTINNNNCKPWCPSANVAIRCFESGECTGDGSIRLVDGFVEHEGRVEVCVNGVWGTVCDLGWDLTDSHIICQQLGHPELAPVAFHNSYFGDGVYPIIYSNLQCIGFEDRISDCVKDTYLQFSCSRDHTAGVLCGQDCQDGEIRLVGGPSESEGAVEVCFDHVWGNIAESGWSEKDASLICKLLNFLEEDPIPLYGSYYGKTAATAHISDLYCTGDESVLLDCSMTIYSLSEGKQLLSLSQVAAVSCKTENTCVPPPPGSNFCIPGDVQVDIGDEGNLMYCANGTWSPFCSLNGTTAAVACRQLGYTSFSWAGIIDDGRYNPTSNVSLFQNFTCTGTESFLSECIPNDDCISTCDIPYGIQCYEPGQCTQQDVRLVGGDIAQEGRIEVCIDGVWSAVCSDNWNKIDALVVCNQLGLGKGEPIIYTDSSTFGETYGPIVYSNVECQGWESDLSFCDKTSYNDVICSRSNMAGLVCRDVCEEGAIKLVGSDNENEGTVVICKDSFWGLIGQTTWNSNAAKVTCSQLGYPTDGAIGRLNSYYGKPDITLQSSSVVCSGSESTLTGCAITWVPYDQGKTAVTHVDVAGVYCPPATQPPNCETLPPPAQSVCTNSDVRIVGINNNNEEGLLQYCYNGQWSGFCSLDTTTAAVACKTLGYSKYSWASLITDGDFGPGDGYSYFNNIQCEGSENTLSECQLTADNCLPKCDNNIGIRCFNQGNCSEGVVRLADGGFSQRGRVEQCRNGVWGSVCDLGWDDTDAYTTCKGLGYPGSGATAYKSSKFGYGDGPAIYTNVQCGGSESGFDACKKDNYAEVTCERDDLAGALCTSDCSDGDVRLVDGKDDTEGTVQICYNKIWGMVSGFNWGTFDATVVCRQLGKRTDDVIAIVGSHFGIRDDTVHLTNVGCFGDETGLADCNSDWLDIGSAQQYQNNVAGVSCRASSFTTSSTSSTSRITIAVPSVGVQSSSKKGVTNIVIVLGVLTLLGIIASFAIVIIMFHLQHRRKSKQEKTVFQQNEFEREVVNPLATEASLQGDDDENTKTLQDLIHESEMK